ncbi:hypothetical protein Tco_0562572 [Tanacetum coccineum]
MSSLRSMIGSLMYVTASRSDIMFAVCACSRFQVTPKTSHLSAVKRIFRYLKGKPKLGLWYPKVSSFDLESYSDSDYAGANLDRKSTTGGCQFLGRRLITWQCKKQTIVATSTTEAEYVAAASCCGQVLWIQNQMLDYGFNFMNTKIYIDNESTIWHSRESSITSRTDKAYWQLGRPTSYEMLIEKNSYSSWKSHVCITEKELAVCSRVKQIDSSCFVLWIQSKNSRVKHLEDMDYIDHPKSNMAYIPDTYICSIFLDKVSTDHGKVSTSLQVCTAKERLEKNTADRHITAKKGKHFSGKVTPYVDTMLVQPTQDEGASSERLSDEQPSPSPAPTSEVPNESLPDSSSAQPSEVPFEQQPDPSPRPSPRPSPKPSPTPIVPDSIPEPTGENIGDHSSNDASLSGNEDDMTLQNVYDLCISLCKQVSDQAKEIKLLKAKITKLKKQAKPVIKHHKAYLKSVSLQQRFPRKSFSKKHRVHKESVSKQGRKKAKGESSVQRDPLTDKEGVSTDFEKVSTDRPIVSTDGSKVSTDEQVEGTEEHNEGTEEIFEGTEEQREGTEEKVESTEEQIKAEEERNKIAEEKATNEALIRNFDDIKARIEADRILAEKLQMQKEAIKSQIRFIALWSVEDDRLIQKNEYKRILQGEENKQESKKSHGR